MSKPPMPFGNKTQSGVRPVELQVVSAAQNVGKSNIIPMTTSPVAMRTTTAVTKNDIDLLGSNIQNNIGTTTNKIIETMKVSQAGDLGSLLVQVQSQAERLDPSKQFGGFFGWLKKRSINIKSYLKQEFATTEKVFDELVTDMSKRIAANDNWIKNLDKIFEENHTNYQTLVGLIAKAESWKQVLKAQIDYYPAIDPNDPEAMMKAQDKRDLESLLNRVDQKIDIFKRLKMMTENNAPKIRGQQQTSENTMQTLRNIIDFVIPTIKQEFVFYLHSIETKSDQELISNTKVFAQNTMMKSADAASQSAIDSAKNLNAPLVDNPTLDYLRQKILTTVTEVKRLETESAASREADAITMQNSTSQFIQQLTN